MNTTVTIRNDDLFNAANVAVNFEFEIGEDIKIIYPKELQGVPDSQDYSKSRLAITATLP